MLDISEGELKASWVKITPYVQVINTSQKYEDALCVLSDIIDIVGGCEDHPLQSMMEVLAVLIEKYEEQLIGFKS